jgi:myo-inositol 2-dehydrogenase / D-chiro-inositol 1-dehydrogenase
MRVGIIGTNWGLMHLGAFRAAGAEVVALCGQNEGKTRDIARREGVPLATTDVEALCASAEIVVVAGPDRAHPDHIRAALRAGRHVLSEKPLTRTAQEAREIAALEAGLPPGRVCAVNFPYRMLPPVSALARWVWQRPPARHVSVTVLNRFAAAEGWATEGPLLGQSGDFGGLSHVVDAALWLMGGAPVWVQAALTGRPVHTVTLHVGLSTGAQVTVNHLPATAPGIHGQWAILGDGWQATFAGGYEPALGGWRIGPACVFEGGEKREIGTRVEPQPGQREPWAEAHVGTARALLEAIRGGERGALARFAEGAMVQEVLGAAMRSEEEGKRVRVEGSGAAALRLPGSDPASM